MISADSSRSIWDLAKALQVTTWAPMSEVPDYWLNHPSESSKCLSFRTINIAMIDWHTTEESLTRDGTISLNLNTEPDERIKAVIECSRSRKIAVEISKQQREDSTTKVFFFEASSLHNSSPGADSEGKDTAGEKVISPLSEFVPLSKHIEHVIGAYNNRLLFLSRDLWVCTVELEKRPSFSRRDTDAFSNDAESRRPSISQRLNSGDSQSSQQRRRRERSTDETLLGNRLSMSPPSRLGLGSAESSRRSSVPHTLSQSPQNSLSPSQVPHYFRHFFVPTS